MEALVTLRLLLRPWRDSDIPPFAAMCADPRVMAHYPKLLSQGEATALAERIRAGMGEARPRTMGGRSARSGAIHRLCRTVRAELAGALHAMRRDRLALAL
jgi:hypothetical protein